MTKLAQTSPSGNEMHRFITEMYPICRSITGDGLRQTLRLISDRLPLQLTEIPTGTAAFDWTVPKEWNFRDAWIKNSRGEKVVDARKCNLHLVNYSIPVHRKMPLAELKDHLHSLPQQPEMIPYRTSYYAQTWGFCLPDRLLRELPEDEYEVLVDTTLADGVTTYGEAFIAPTAGDSRDEVLFSCHCCHPSLCNDNLSGIAVLTFLANRLAARKQRRLGYRFLFIPATIGSIVWLSRNEAAAARVKAGLVATLLGDAGSFTYKQSRRGDALIDRAVAQALRDTGKLHAIEAFSPYGYDERQYCSPGFNMPVGCLMRSPHGKFPEYHTSADNLDFVKPQYLDESLRLIELVTEILEGNAVYVNTNPKCEPQLGKRGLYRATGGYADPGQLNMAILWALNFSDGGRDLLSIAERSGMRFPLIRQAADVLLEHGLLRSVQT